MSDQSRQAHLEIIEARGQLGGRFRDPRRLGANGGAGNFSLIFRAYDESSARDVALKFYNPERLVDTYRWESFRREAQILERLAGQPDIIGFVAGPSDFKQEVVTPSGITFEIPFFYYALELAECDAATVIARKLWGANESLLAFRVMCRAVRRIHSMSIVHRDLKPDCFLVARDGSLKLADFGTARHLVSSEQAIAPAYHWPPGELRYVAPEIFGCLHDVDPSFAYGADVFSLGAILFELFSGAQLGVQVFGPGLLTDLIEPMAQVSRTDRIRIYSDMIGSIADRYPLPSIGSFGPDTPRCIRDRLDLLYRGMCAIDYRRRLCDFSRIFLQIDTCLLILRNEARYRSWREQSRRRRLGKTGAKASDGVAL